MVENESNLSYHSEINNVDLYETRAVSRSRGVSYGKRGYMAYYGSSSSNQEWKKLARGTLTLGAENCYFIGGGEQRTINRSKLVNVRYYSDASGIEVTVSNRQKVMKFLLPGRSIEDGQRLANAIIHGQSAVLLSNNTSNLGMELFGSFLGILKGIILLMFLLFLFVFLVTRLARFGLILWILIVGLFIFYYFRK